MLREMSDISDLFEALMLNDWDKVYQLYQSNPSSSMARLTVYEETALHIAVSNYNQYRDDFDLHLWCIVAMVNSIPPEDKVKVLSLKDVNGNTPLHLAAILGVESICGFIPRDGRRELIAERNNRNETPLFLAAQFGKLKAFFILREMYVETATDGSDFESLCRDKDGKTVLHAAISRRDFELAFQIISYHPRLAHFVNVDGEYPLHILAGQPTTFRSGLYLRYYEVIIYSCIRVTKLKKENVNYRQLMEDQNNSFLSQQCFGYGGRSRTDEENPHNNESNNSHGTDKERPRKNMKNCKGKYDHYLAMIKRIINFFLTLMMLFLITFRIGYNNIKRIQRKKQRHIWATQIMETIIQPNTSENSYYSTGKAPANTIPTRRDLFELPAAPPKDDSDTQIEENKNKVENDSGMNMKQNTKMETPFITAAKMGIVEMVDTVLKKYPMAILELDENGKNALLLAIEHRQAWLLKFLLDKKLPEFVYAQVDHKGNGAFHLAASLPQLDYTWSVTGAALQMNMEINWFKHVRRCLAKLPIPWYNKEGVTPKELFRETHKNLAKDGIEWLIKTSESGSVIAALIATVSFATAATVPGGFNSSGYPVHGSEAAFTVFTISSLGALWFSLTSLVSFLAIITTRRQVRDFERNLPTKLLVGICTLFISIAAMLVSFCAALFFLIDKNLKGAALPVYVFTLVPPLIFATAQLPLYIDLVRAAFARGAMRQILFRH